MTTLGVPDPKIGWPLGLCCHGINVDNNTQPDNKNYQCSNHAPIRRSIHVATASIKKPIHNVKEELRSIFMAKAINCYLHPWSMEPSRPSA
jgi:hypothetical protein